MNLSEYKRAEMRRSTYDNIVKGSEHIVEVLKQMKRDTKDYEYQWWLEDYMQEIIVKVKFLEKPSDVTNRFHVKDNTNKKTAK